MITRCVLAFANSLHRTPMDKPDFQRLIAAQPEACPHGDCSPGGCRAHCREFALGEWAKRETIQRRA